MTTLAADEKHIDLVFHALADSTRRAILMRVANRALSVTEIAEPFQMSLAAVSKHLKVLERAGLLNRKKQGCTHYLMLNAEGMATAEEWLAHYRAFWGDRLQSLQQFLEEEP